MEKLKILLLTLVFALLAISVHAQQWFDYTANGVMWYCMPLPDGTAVLKGIKGTLPSGVLNIPDAVIDNSGQHHAVSKIDKLPRCNSVTEVNIPASVKTVGKAAFIGWEGLTTVGMPYVENIEESAFSACKNLTTINMNPKIIGTEAFSRCPLFPVLSLTNIERIESYAFSQTGIKTINLGSNLTEIQDRAFSYCLNLENVNLSEGLTKIGNGCFGSCHAITSLSIPSTVTSIGFALFDPNSQYYNTKLNCTNIHYSPSLLKQIIENGSFAYLDWVGTTFEIPTGITKIGRNCFDGCKSWVKNNLTLENVVIQSSAFKGLSNLTGTLTLKNCTLDYSRGYSSETFYGTKFNHLVLGTNEETLNMQDQGIYTMFGSIPGGPSTYDEFKRLVPDFPARLDLTILDGPKNIVGPYMWGTLDKVHLPSTAISVEGFYDCFGITSINLPEGLKTIRSTAFRNCSFLTLSTPFPSTVTRIESYAFDNCAKLQGDINNYLPAGLQYLSADAFRNCRGLTGEAVVPPLLPLLDYDYTITNGNPFVHTSVYAIRMGVREKFFCSNIDANWEKYSGLLYVDSRNCEVCLTNDKGAPNTAYKFARSGSSYSPDISVYGNFWNTSVNTLIYLPSEIHFQNSALPTATFDQRFDIDENDDETGGDASNFIMDGKCKQFFVKDGLPYRVPFAFTAQTARYSRTFNVTTGKAVSTLYLPYPTDLPEGMCAYTLVKKNVHSDGEKTFVFREVPQGTRLSANKPYLVRITDGQTHKLPVMHNVAVPVSPSVDAAGQIGIEDSDWKFFGTTEKIDNAAAYAKKAYYLNDNKWWAVQNGVENDYIAPFRCFVSSPTGAAASRSFLLVLEGDDDSNVTGINQLESDTEKDIHSGKYPFYSVDGKLMGKDYNKLERGQIYIVNGKKFYKF